ncbi:transposase [Candidatus Micrarchaeota archaeon]|nr:transposase [Candidatus Micrarchaeota archaeon]
MHDVVLDAIFDKLDFIPDVFKTKPKAENFLAFFFGICLCPMSTMNAFSEWLDGWKNQSSLNRFLTSGCWKVSQLKEKYLGWLGTEIEAAKRTIYFIIDDSKSKKTGDFIEKASMDYDSNEGRHVLCHTLVTSLVKLASFELPFELTLYDKTKKGKDSFKSKLDIAIEHATAFMKIAGKDRRVIFLFDAWYCAVKFISKLPAGVFWVSRLKKNRLVKIGDFWHSLKELQCCVKAGNFKRIKVNCSHFWACSLKIEVKGLGLVTLVLVKDTKHSRFVEFFVSNLDETAEEILGHYSKRWSIEVFFRAMKQNLGLDGYQMRKYKGIRRYWAIVQLTYAILAVLRRHWKRTCKTIGEAIAQLRRHARKYEKKLGWVIENYVGEKIAKL